MLNYQDTSFFFPDFGASPLRKAMNFTKCPFTSSSCQDGERKLWWKRSPSLSLCRPSQKRGLHPIYCWAAVFLRAGPWQEKCQASFWRVFASLNDGWQRWKARRKPAHRSARGNYSKKQMSRRSREVLIPPSLQHATCFKEQNFIKFCHMVFVSQCGRCGGGGGWCVRGGVKGLELRHRRAINSAPPSVLFTCIRKQQVVTEHSHDTTNTAR